MGGIFKFSQRKINVTLR